MTQIREDFNIGQGSLARSIGLAHPALLETLSKFLYFFLIGGAYSTALIVVLPVAGRIGELTVLEEASEACRTVNMYTSWYESCTFSMIRKRPLEISVPYSVYHLCRLNF